MLIDARSLPDGHQIDADIVIIGGGIAGITLAREWAGYKSRIAILESGDVEFDDATQDLYSGSAVMSGPENADRNIDNYLTNSRFRYYGGSGNAWGGKCVPLDEADFMARDWVGHSGWPFGRADLQPFYDRACDQMEIPRFNLDFDRPQEEGRPPLNVNGARNFSSLPRYFTRYSGFADPDAYQGFKTSVTEEPNVDVYLNANVTEIATNEAGDAVDHLVVKTLSGLSHRARGQVYVLATGGIENVRLLLASNRVQQAGLGNANDLVGRYWQGHANLGMYSGPFGTNSSLYLTAWDKSMSLYVDTDRDQVNTVLGLNARGQRQFRVPNFTVTFNNVWYRANAVSRVAQELAARIDAGDRGAGQHYQCYFKCEHMPNPESRITLTDEVDALGMPKLRLDWRFTERDWESYENGIAALRRELGAAGLGRVQWPLDRSQFIEEFSFARHHMGATRIHPDAKRGVVDADCRMHGVDNLYIAGSSVFPTSGNANPTLTILALTNRLSDHLKARLGEA